MATPAAFSEKTFFGDAIVGVLPENWIDVSDLRQVPDHQEIFLSPTTLSSLIIEINERVSREEVVGSLVDQQQESFSADGRHANPQAEDIAAAFYHLRDISDEGDTMEVINPLRPVTLGKFSSGPQQLRTVASAYAGLVSLRRGASVAAPVAFDGDTAGSSATGPRLFTHSCHFLLIRLEPQQTDLLVSVNVPHEEFDLRGDPRGLFREEDLASGLLGKLIETLEIRNWGLFGQSISV
ncbi:hypothetical protein Egran_05512 [Elaphomyces granulatus]|uniref:Ran-interacting Mog1 protein n=1 Tax=Elaphomyces granulatus TaxID=519963 RepID=A0A232LRD1_9EURO|nr:hypothetical protein Egran_05512 [Elaphomyces granulatus]